MKIVRIIFNLLIFILLLVLALNNMQNITLDFYGIHTFNMPLIIALVVFISIGFIIGILTNLAMNLKLKAQLHQLNRKLSKQNEKESSTNHVI